MLHYVHQLVADFQVCLQFGEGCLACGLFQKQQISSPWTRDVSDNYYPDV